MFTLAKQSKTSHGWFKGFPYAHPDPTLPAVIFNDQTRHVQEPRRALGAGAADRHQGGVDGVVSRRGDDLGDRRAADRHDAGRLPRAAREPGCRTSRSTPASSKIKPYDPTVGKQIADMLRPSMGDQIPTDPDGDRQVVRPRLVEAQPAGRAAELLERAGFTKTRRQLVHARRQAVRHQAHGRGRGAAGDDPRRQHDRPAMAPVRHRRHDGGGAGHAWPTAAPPATSRR